MDRSAAHRRIIREQGVILVIALAAGVLVSDSDQWDRPGLIALLLAVTLLGDRLTADLGALRVSMVDTGIALAAVLAGPAPGMAIAVVAMLVDGAVSRLPLHAMLVNMASMAAAAVICGVGVEALVEAGTIDPGEGSFALAAAIGTLVVKVIGFLDVLYARGLAGFVRRDALRVTVLPLAPWEGVTTAITAGTAHSYETIGGEALVGLMVLLVFLKLLLDGIAANEQRQREIAELAADRERYMREALAAEERERRRLAAELHDDALQTLLSARADLVDGLDGDRDRLLNARDALAATVSKLRSLLTRIGPAPGTGPLGPGLRALAAQVGGQAGFEAHVEVAPDVETVEDDIVFSVVRELLVNVAKHAHATRVEVRLVREGEMVALEVLDDGVGFEEADRDRSLAGGHIGLVLLEQRVASRAGSLSFGSRPGGGTVATALMRLASDVPVPAA